MSSADLQAGRQPGEPTALSRDSVLASAGSGKTYRLSSRVIELSRPGRSSR